MFQRSSVQPSIQVKELVKKAGLGEINHKYQHKKGDESRRNFYRDINIKREEFEKVCVSFLDRVCCNLNIATCLLNKLWLSHFNSKIHLCCYYTNIFVYDDIEQM